MELRVLQYFLAVAREQSISGAAEALHLSQPTLSRQLKDMEEELGKQLFIRGNRHIELTEEGVILRNRAEQIMELVWTAEHEIVQSDSTIAGDVRIGSGETDGIRFLAKTAKELRSRYPEIKLHIYSGDTEFVAERIDRGLLDFGVLSGDVDAAKYEFLKIPSIDRIGVLMRKDAPLAQKEIIAPEELIDKPLIVSQQMLRRSEVGIALHCNQEKLNIAATYSLLFNGSLLVEEGIGYALCFDHIINTSGSSSLCFRKLSSSVDVPLYVVWKKYQTFSKAAEKFLTKMQEIVAE